MRIAVVLLFLVLAICGRERTGSKVGDSHSKPVKRSNLHLRSDTDRKREDSKKNRAELIRPRIRRGMKESARESSEINLRSDCDGFETGSRAHETPDHGETQGGGGFMESSSESNAKAGRKETIWASSSDIVQREDMRRPPPPAKTAPPKPKVYPRPPEQQWPGSPEHSRQLPLSDLA